MGTDEREEREKPPGHDLVKYLGQGEVKNRKRSEAEG